MFKTYIAEKLIITMVATVFFIPNVAYSNTKIWIADNFSELGTVDITTGSVNIIGNMGILMTDIAFDPDGNLWGITFTTLYKIDKSTATVTRIGSLGTTLNSLEFSPSGILYGANSSLYIINTTTGSASIVGNGGYNYRSSGDLAFIGNDLFLSSRRDSVDKLVKINVNNGSGSVVGAIGFSTIFGLSSNGIDLVGVTNTNIIMINPTTGEGTSTIDYFGEGLRGAYGTAFEPTVAFPQYSPFIEGHWEAHTNDDSSPDHLSNQKYDVCFQYTGQRGTHDAYSTYIFGSDEIRARGIAHQEGDQVSLFAEDESDFKNSHKKFTSQWDLVEGPKTEKLMGAGHWIQWGNTEATKLGKRSVIFNNVRYNKIADNCKEICSRYKCPEIN